MRLIASKRSAGQAVETPWGAVRLEIISEKIFRESDIALFAVGSEFSRQWRDCAISHNCLVIDNSSAFRYEPDVPLVIPEINPQKAFDHHGVIANPNCTTAIAAVALWPLHKKFGLKKIIVSTYQATSGAGAKGMQELLDQTREVLDSRPAHSENFAHQIAFNLIPHIDAFQENGYTKEEMKVAWETKKIFGLPIESEEIKISCTAVRIPTLRAHAESIVIETAKPVTPRAAREILKKTPGVEVVDDPEEKRYPMPIGATRKYDVEVGRIRQNLVFGNHGLEFFVCGDQLLKGAALNAVQIAELFIENRRHEKLKSGRLRNLDQGTFVAAAGTDDNNESAAAETRASEEYGAEKAH